MAVDRSRLPFARLVAVLAALVTVAVVVARQVGPPLGGASYPVLAAALGAAAVLVHTHLTLDPGWITWRRGVGALALAALAVPGWSALAMLASYAAPYTPLAWGTAVLAGTAHLPLLAAFSLLPLLAVRYLGRGSTRRPAAAVLGLLAAAALSFAAFFDDFAPLAAGPLLVWEPGVVVGTALNAAFLATVLLGPLVALRATRRVGAEAVRRLGTVGASSLAGAALVMLCGALGPSAGDAAAVVVYGGMYLAVTVVVVRSSRALRVRLPDGAARDDTTRDGSTDDAATDDSATDDSTADDGTAAAPVVAVAPAPPGRASADRLGPLTARETEILALLADGLSNAGIAARLVLSQRTVDAHLRSVFAKLDLPDSPQDNRRVHAVLAYREGVAGPRRTG